MNKTFSKVLNIITTVLVVIAILLAIALVGVRLVGLEPYAVLSGSMEPEYHVGSLVYVKQIDSAELKVGDDITFMVGDETTIVTHRIIEILPDEEDSSVLRFRTQGIANTDPDAGTVHCNNVIGKVVFTIPILGYVSNIVKNLWISVPAGLVLILLIFLPDIFKKEEAQKESTAEEKAEE